MKVRIWLEKIFERVALYVALVVGYRFNMHMTYLSMEYWLKKIDGLWIDGVIEVDEFSVSSCGDYLENLDNDCFRVWEVRKLYEDYVYWLKMEYESWALRMQESIREYVEKLLEYEQNNIEESEMNSTNTVWDEPAIRAVLSKIDGMIGTRYTEEFVADYYELGEVTDRYKNQWEVIEDYLFYVRYSKSEVEEMYPKHSSNVVVEELKELYVWNRVIVVSKVLGIVVVVVVAVCLFLGGI